MKTRVTLLLLILIYLLMNFYCLFSESPVWDEPTHLTAGKIFWRTREFILEPVEPPFARLITSLPIVLSFQELMTGRLGEIYFYPRLVVILIGCLFLIFFYKTLKELFDEKLAILGIILFIFEPNLLTHSHYNTTDFIFTALFFISVYLLRKKSFFLPVFLAFLFATKVTGLVFFLFTASLIFIYTFFYSDKNRNLDKLLNRLQFKSQMRQKKLLAFIFLFFLTFWACYLFKTKPAIGEKTAEIGRPYLFYIFENKPFWLRVFKTPLPFIDYLATLKYAISYQKAGHDAYFAGNYSRFGWWWYFLVVFLLKTPIPLLISFFIGLTFLFTREISNIKYQKSKIQIKKQKGDSFFYLIPIMTIFFLSLFIRINIGLRHILPVYPFLIIIALFGWQRLRQKSKWWRLILTGLLTWYIFRTLYFLPHPITFTNEILPPGKSYKVLADSNLSWGQELLAIKKWQKSTHQLINKSASQPINLFYFGNVRAEDYLNGFTQWGCKDYKNFQRLLKEKQSPILVSATCLQKMAAHYDKKILDIKPQEIIANSILVYY